MARAKDRNYVTIQAMFNLTDPDQAKLYAHASERTNRSEYIKRLIQRDMEMGAVVYAAPAPVAAPVVSSPSNEDFDLNGFT